MRRRVLRSPQLRMRSTYAYVGVDTHSLAPGHGSQRLPQTPRQPAHERRDPHLARAQTAAETERSECVHVTRR